MASNDKPPRWLEWAREIQAISQTGSQFAHNEYDRQRYQRLREIAAEIVSEHAEISYPELLHIYCEQIGYATPRVDVRAAVFKDGRLLMVRERVDGGWTMPGGWADVGERPAEAAEREVWEEAGFQVKAIKVVGIYDNNRIEPLQIFHAFKIVFLCELVGGEATPSFETTEVRFFGLDEIPLTLSGERTKPHHISDAFRAIADPELPTVFD